MSSSLLTLSRVSLRRGDRPLVEDVSCAIERGEVVALMGASGSGKSTLLRAIVGLEPLHSGAIDVAGHVLTAGPSPSGRAARELHTRVGMVFQFHHLFAHLTVLENISLAPVHALGRSRVQAEHRAHELLIELSVDHRAAAYPHELSGGEAQRVAIARALAVEPPLLLMDEPTASLDPARRGELAVSLRALTERGRTLLVATHDQDFVRALTSRVVLLEGGRLAKDGRAAEVF